MKGWPALFFSSCSTKPTLHKPSQSKASSVPPQLQPYTNNIFVCDSNNQRVQVFDSEDNQLPLYSIASGLCPSGIDCDTRGQIAVSDSTLHQVRLYDTCGRFMKSFGQEGSGNHELCRPMHVRFASLPNCMSSTLLLIADQYNSRVAIWTGDGQKHLTSFPVGVFDDLLSMSIQTSAFGVCVDMQGVIYVTSWMSGAADMNMLQAYDPRTFRLLQEWGSCCLDGPGEFAGPAGVCVDDSNVLMVADAGNHRVQFFV